MRPYHKPLSQRRQEALARIVKAQAGPDWGMIIAGPYRRNNKKTGV